MQSVSPAVVTPGETLDFPGKSTGSSKKEKAEKVGKKRGGDPSKICTYFDHSHVDKGWSPAATSRQNKSRTSAL